MTKSSSAGGWSWESLHARMKMRHTSRMSGSSHEANTSTVRLTRGTERSRRAPRSIGDERCDEPFRGLSPFAHRLTSCPLARLYVWMSLSGPPHRGPWAHVPYTRLPELPHTEPADRETGSGARTGPDHSRVFHVDGEPIWAKTVYQPWWAA